MAPNKTVDKTVALLALLRNLTQNREPQALHIVRVDADTPTVTLIFEGTGLALDTDIFEIPAAFNPLLAGQRFFALPIAGGGAAPRWGLIQKL